MSQDGRDDDAFTMPTLAELIAEQRRLRGFSYRDLEARADSAITHQRWQQLGSGSRVKEFSEPATIRAMARALDVDETLVVLSMAKSIGLDVELGGAQSALARMLPGAARGLTAEQRHAVVGIIRAMTQVRSDSLDNRQLGSAARDVDRAAADAELDLDSVRDHGEELG